MSDPSEVPPPRKAGRPSSGVPRKEQIRRAVAARRAGLINLQLLLSPAVDAALQSAAEAHPAGKADYALGILENHLRSQGHLGAEQPD